MRNNICSDRFYCSESENLEEMYRRRSEWRGRLVFHCINKLEKIHNLVKLNLENLKDKMFFNPIKEQRKYADIKDQFILFTNLLCEGKEKFNSDELQYVLDLFDSYFAELIYNQYSNQIIV